ncbi:hypothetical protein Tdes44962_MAKER04667 [Teratosphaeria destructans]|uniref:Secreted protein n=1 Tax=Teratosphaeria destructans TaxID=418781 RepID=A0A9W7VZM4_9PEZI|nr:hypothetical protein Tdes44962_MAKER04667 [Teratosphaeria destructans]
MGVSGTTTLLPARHRLVLAAAVGLLGEDAVVGGETDGGVGLLLGVGRSFSWRRRRLCGLAVAWWTKLCSLSNHLAHGTQYHWPKAGRSSGALVS